MKVIDPSPQQPRSPVQSSDAQSTDASKPQAADSDQAAKARDAQAQKATANTQQAASADYQKLAQGASAARDQLEQKLKSLDSQIASLRAKGELTPVDQGKLATLTKTAASLTQQLHKLDQDPLVAQGQKELRQLDAQLAAFSAKPSLTEDEQAQMRWLDQKRAALAQKLGASDGKSQSAADGSQKSTPRMLTELKVMQEQMRVLQSKQSVSTDQQQQLSTLEAKFEKALQRAESTISSQLSDVNKKILELVQKKDFSSIDSGELRKLVKERSKILGKTDAATSTSGAAAAKAATGPSGMLGMGGGGPSAPPAATPTGSPAGAGTGAAAGGASSDAGASALASGGTGSTAMGAGLSVTLPGSSTIIGSPIEAAGGDIDNMVGHYATTLDAYTSRIETLMSRGDLNESDSRALQWLILKRSELSMLISQIMSVAHETRKHIIQMIRA